MRHTAYILSFILTASILLLSCGEVKHDEEQTAAIAAERYYQLLPASQYAMFVDGMVGADSMPLDYRRQLTELVRKQMETRWQKHGEWQSITATNVEEQGDQANVTLELRFADGTTDQIFLPMIYINNEWKMQ